MWTRLFGMYGLVLGGVIGAAVAGFQSVEWFWAGLALAAVVAGLRVAQTGQLVPAITNGDAYLTGLRVRFLIGGALCGVAFALGWAASALLGA